MTVCVWFLRQGGGTDDGAAEQGEAACPESRGQRLPSPLLQPDITVLC